MDKDTTAHDMAVIWVAIYVAMKRAGVNWRKCLYTYPELMRMKADEKRLLNSEEPGLVRRGAQV